jgi:hypothetical protein
VLDVPVFETVDDLQWQGPGPEFERYCERIQAPGLFARANEARTRRGLGTSG